MMRFPQLTSTILLLGIVQSQGLIQNSNCGRLGPNTTTPLITNSYPTHHWPWHVAVYHKLDGRNPIYKCGGTLINSKAILTAAHCVVYNNVPLNGKQVSISLGRLNLDASEPSAQSIEVAEIFAHENYSSIDYANDIAIIKLSAGAIFNNYVKPICLWKKDKVDLREVIGKSGTVIGFGLTEKRDLSSVLQKASLPVIDTFVCLKSNPDFFGRHLSATSFCAGLQNGTSVCTGDSGGSMTFEDSGRYHIRGIVSVGSSVIDPNTNELVCDSTQFALFTDVAQYLPWIGANLFRCEISVRCDWDDNDECTVFSNETLSTQDCDIILDETSNTAVIRLSVAGYSDAIPKFANAVTLFANLEDLFLRGIQLRNITRGRLTEFRKIKRLHLDSNEISQLDAGTFDDLTNLVGLNVDENRIKELHRDLLKELRNLEVFSLTKNQIETLPADIFRNNVKLEHLSLGENKLKELHVDSFKELQSLKYLALDGNRFETLPAEIFHYNTKTQWLSLSANQLTVLHSDLFKDLVNLETLFLDYNHITALQENIFRNGKMLQSLYLEHNQLNELPSGVFRELENLEILELSTNKIETLPEDIFRYNTKMQQLFLDGNELKNIDADFFKELPNLRVLILHRKKRTDDK